MILASRYIDEVGDGSGNKNMVGDYSATPKEFLLKPAENEIYYLTRMLPFVVDSGSFDSGSYGNGITLVNGIDIFVRRGGVRIIDITAGLPILKNTEWNRLCYDVAISTYGSGNESLAARYTFTKENPKGIVLDGKNGDELVCLLNDDFSDLVEHYIRVGFSK